MKYTITLAAMLMATTASAHTVYRDGQLLEHEHYHDCRGLEHRNLPLERLEELRESGICWIEEDDDNGNGEGSPDTPDDGPDGDDGGDNGDSDAGDDDEGSSGGGNHCGGNCGVGNGNGGGNGTENEGNGRGPQQ